MLDLSKFIRKQKDIKQLPTVGQDADLTTMGEQKTIIETQLPEVGKIRQIETEPQQTPSNRYQLTPFDLESERRIGAPCPNPKNYKCWLCGCIGERYALAQDDTLRWWWGWVCCKCIPYNPEQN